MRTEFRIWHHENQAHYAMFNNPGSKTPTLISEFPIASEPIQRRMQTLIKTINQNSLLKEKLFGVEFLSCKAGDCIVTLLYHKKLDENWTAKANELSVSISAQLIGRSRKQKIVLQSDHIFEEFDVSGTTYLYQQVESSFTQPNALINQKMLNWVSQRSSNFGGDLLELYCGNGNFTLPLSKNFNHVLATEVSKVSTRSALHNIGLNKINNIRLVRMSSEEITSAMNNERPFRRLKEIDLDAYNFNAVFVDPPRAGLDASTLKLVSHFNHIIYISCNPLSLMENLSTLSHSHDITDFAVFDQFPNTPHLECGVLLKKCQN